MLKKSLYTAIALAGLIVAAPLAAQQSSSDGSTLTLKQGDVATIEQLLGTEVPKNGGGGIIRVGAANFGAGSGQITFTEFAVGTTNPTYAPANYGGAPTGPTLSFGGFFAGQALGTAGTCPAGAALTGCVVGTATNPLALAPASPSTSIVTDNANPTSPVLSGSPTFNGPIAILFDRNLAAVGLDGGFFNAVGGTAITAFRRDGSVIGSVSNTALGIEFLGLATADGSESIAGLLFSLVGAEPAGFAIDNVRFAAAGQVVGVRGPEPVPANNVAGLIALLLALGLAGVAFLRLR